MEKKKSVFQTLSAINVKSKVKRKNNLNYLSWSDAWAMLKEVYPDAQRVIYENEHTGLNYWTDGKTAWVKVGIEVEGIEHIDMLPVMDFRNQSITDDIHGREQSYPKVNGKSYWSSWVRHCNLPR